MTRAPLTNPFCRAMPGYTLAKFSSVRQDESFDTDRSETRLPRSPVAMMPYIRAILGAVMSVWWQASRPPVRRGCLRRPPSGQMPCFYCGASRRSTSCSREPIEGLRCPLGAYSPAVHREVWEYIRGLLAYSGYQTRETAPQRSFRSATRRAGCASRATRFIARWSGIRSRSRKPIRFRIGRRGRRALGAPRGRVSMRGPRATRILSTICPGD